MHRVAHAARMRDLSSPTIANHDSHDLEQSGPWLFRLLDSIRYGGRVADQVQPLMPGVGMATRVNH